MEEQELKPNQVKLKKGIITLKRPLAGARNKALIASYMGSKDGKPQINEFQAMVLLLPNCVESHPFGSVKINEALDSLEINEYTNLIKKLEELINENTEIEKK